jgi:hypothetical protein
MSLNGSVIDRADLLVLSYYNFEIVEVNDDDAPTEIMHFEFPTTYFQHNKLAELGYAFPPYLQNKPIISYLKLHCTTLPFSTKNH